MGKGFYFTFEALLFFLAMMMLVFAWPRMVPSNDLVYKSTLMMCDDILLVVTSSGSNPALLIESLTNQLNPDPLVSFSRDDQIMLSRSIVSNAHLSCQAPFWNGSRVETIQLTLAVFS